MAYEEDVEERIRFLQLDDATTSTMQSVQSLIEDGIDESLGKFYAHILQEPTLKKLFSDKEAIASARSAQKRHWLKTLFTANPGKAQFDQAEQIGLAHMRIGLSPSWYMSGYCFMLNQFVGLIADRYQGDAKGLSQIIQALNKLVFIDMHFVIDAYLEAKNRSMVETLLRVTRFTEDVEGLNQGLASAVQDLQTSLEALIARDKALKERAVQIQDMLSQASTPAANPQIKQALDSIASLVDEIDAAGSGAQKAFDSSGELTAQIKKMDERLKQLQFSDKLYSPLGKDAGLRSRVKAFIDKHL
jgi:FtsZ-binding cell division protein ZapB